MIDEELRKLYIAKLKKLEAMQHAYYTPIGVVEKYIEALGSTDYFISVLSAANGIGKTWAGINIFANLLFPTENKYFNHKLFRKFPYSRKRARIISEPTTLQSTIIPALHQILPKGRFEVEKRGKNYDYSWKTDTGWEFDCLTYEQDAKEFESATLSIAWMDEPPTNEIYKATIARMRLGGQIMITATPLYNSSLIDELIKKSSLKDSNVFSITADVESACEDHGIRGFLKHDNIERMISEYSDDEKQARVFGKPQHHIGRIYKQFDRKIHVISPFNVNNDQYTTYHALDPHPRHPDAGLWLSVDDKGSKFVTAELVVKCTGGTKELAERIKSIHRDYPRIHANLIDPSAFIVDQHAGSSLATRLNKYGLNYREGTKKRQQANARIGEALDFARQGTQMIQEPELYIFDTCHNLIEEIENYRWKEWTGRGADNRGQREEPVDKADHLIEDLGRLLLFEPDFVRYEYQSNYDNNSVKIINDDPYD